MNLFPMRDGVLLNGKHSLADYGMVMKDRPIIGPPEPKTATIDVPGSDGLLDMTEAITGEVKFKPRPITLTFKARIADSEQAEFESVLMDDLHGKRIEVILDEDPEWVWTGRASVAFSDKKDWQETITISLTADPYKLAREKTVFELAQPGTDYETVQIGVNTSMQDWNTIFVFGEGDAPLFDATQTTGVYFDWDPDAQRGVWTQGYITFEDAEGHSHRFPDVPLSYGGVRLAPYNLVDSEDFKFSKVRRIVLTRIRAAVMAATYEANYLVSRNTIFIDRMPVAPRWYINAHWSDTQVEESAPIKEVLAIINDKVVSIKTNEWHRNAEIRLVPGENSVVLRFPLGVDNYADTTPLLVEFRQGRL